MKPITLPTSPETRATLEKAGWYLLDPRLISRERWCHDNPSASILLDKFRSLPVIDQGTNFLKALEFAAILGIHAPGFRTIPEDVASRLASYAGYAMSAFSGLGFPVGADIKMFYSPPQIPIQDQAPPQPQPSEEGARAELTGMVDAASAGYDTAKMTRKLKEFFNEAGDGAESRGEETP